MNQTPNHLNEDLLTRWIDGQLTPEEAALVARQAAESPEWFRARDDAGRIGALLRDHLPAALEPPSPEFFTNSIIDEIRSERSPAPVKPTGSALPRWLGWLRTPWFAPVASAAVVAIAFLFWNQRPVTEPGEFLAQTYTPDPRVKATAWYSEEAHATVIDLENLEAVPDNHEITASDVASAEPPAPGEPLILYAADDAARPVFVLSKDLTDAPRITPVR